MLTLFGNLASGNVHKAQLILRHAGVSYRRVDVDQAKGQAQHDEFRQINPIGKFPALLFDDGDVLTESNAILYHFGRDTALWPSSRRAQSEVLRWMFFEQYSHEPTLSVIRYLLRFAPDPSNSVGQIDCLRPRALHALQTLEERLSVRDWVADEQCSLAVYALYPYTKTADESGFDLEMFPALCTWLGRVERQPNFRELGSEGAQLTLTFEEYFNRPEIRR